MASKEIEEVETHSTPQVVIIAVDRSLQAEKAFDYYVVSLHRKENKVHLIHVPEGVTAEMSKGMRLPDGEWQKMKQQQQDELKDVRKKYDAKLKNAKVENGSLHMAYGKPGEAIVKAAAEFKANVVVMGTRGMGQLRRTILGSVSDYVVHHAHCPVVVCRN